jgi:hypothetical protein
VTVAYLDAEWLVEEVADAPALTVEPDGTIRFGARTATAPAGTDSDAAALLAFASLAAEAVGLLEGAHQVEVTGRGIVAELVRASLGAGPAGEAPRAIVDTTGDPAVIADATRRVADLGLVVLAGEALGRTGDLDVYPDVHVRGLEIVGAGPLLSQPLPAEAPAGTPAPTDVSATGPWYRLER